MDENELYKDEARSIMIQDCNAVIGLILPTISPIDSNWIYFKIFTYHLN